MIYTATFGDRFKELRLERNLTQDKLASIFYITKSSISKYENNNQIPELSALEKFADFFNVSIDYLLGKSDLRTTAKNIVIDNLKFIIGKTNLEQFIKDVYNKTGRLFEINKIKDYLNGDKEIDPGSLFVFADYIEIDVEYMYKPLTNDIIEKAQREYNFSNIEDEYGQLIKSIKDNNLDLNIINGFISGMISQKNNKSTP